jgi:hypothetical protein
MLKQRDKKERLEWELHVDFGDYRENDASNVVNFPKIYSVFCMPDSLLHFDLGISTSGKIISTLSEIKKCVSITSA